MLSIVGAMLGCAACGNGSTAPPWRNCDGAFADLQPAQVPLDGVARPISVGDSLPVFRITSVEDDVESLANRALAMACIATDGESVGTQDWLGWADAALRDEPWESVELPGWIPSYRPRGRAPSVAVRWRMESRSPPTEGDPVGGDGAREIAGSVVARLQDHGLLPNTNYEAVHTAKQVTTSGCPGSGTCETVVDAYSVIYAQQLGSASVLGVHILIQLEADGVVSGIELSTVNIVAAGATIAALSEAEAEARYVDLAAATWPDAEFHIETPGSVWYIAPLPGDPVDVEPVWYGSYLHVFPHAHGRPQPSWISLSDADGPLVAVQ
ncbi:MAG: hypothetical protein JKY37_31165 [Nannocystaceae bacterium]|nr:hypothetical protein [Nannocystaceae bacterium]